MSGLSMGMEEVTRDFLFLFSFLSVSPELIWLLTIATITNYTAPHYCVSLHELFYSSVYLLGAFSFIFLSSIRLLLYW